jgi:alcohol dehydrogenase class IV
LIEGSAFVPHFWFNQSVHFRKGSIAVLKDLPAKKVLVLGYPGASQSDSYKKLITSLEGKTLQEETCTYATEAEVLALRAKTQKNRPDTIIGVGGGQVMDSAKVLRILLENPTKDFANLLESPLAPRGIGYVAVPTTPSTGSEANGTAVIKNKAGIKVPYVSRMMVPDVAVLDSSFLSTLTDEQILTFAGDIFGHAYESMVSKLANSLVQSLGWSMIDLLKQASLELKQTPGDPKALDKLMQAGYLGGLATGSVFVGVCHALAHSLEQQKGIAHSTAVVTLTPRCLSWHAETTKDPIYSRLLAEFESIGLQKYVKPEILNGIDVNTWVKQTLADPSMKTSPIRMKDQDLLGLVNWILKK